MQQVIYPRRTFCTYLPNHFIRIFQVALLQYTMFVVLFGETVLSITAEMLTLNTCILQTL